MPDSPPSSPAPGRSQSRRCRRSPRMHPERNETSGLSRVTQAIEEADLSKRRGRVSDLIGLIIEATGLQVEIGEVCMVGEGRDRPAVATEVVGFRGGRTLLMPLGDLHGIGPGTIVNPTGKPFRVAVGEPLLGRVDRKSVV